MPRAYNGIHSQSLLYSHFFVSENATADEHRDLMNELTTISSISFHENIVNLIGACTTDQGS